MRIERKRTRKQAKHLADKNSCAQGKVLTQRGIYLLVVSLHPQWYVYEVYIICYHHVLILPSYQPKKGEKEPAGKAPAKGSSGAKKGTSKSKEVKPSWRLSFPLYGKKERNFSIGNDILPKRDLTRFVKWPKRIRIQRQKRVLQERLKVPPAIAQFRRVLPKNHGIINFELFTSFWQKIENNTRKYSHA